MEARLLGLFVFSMLLLRSGIAQAPAPQAERILFDRTNQIRAEHHLAALVWDPALSRAARSHAARILREGTSLEHQCAGELDLTHRAAQAGAHFSVVSENLARGRATPAAIEQLWMTTPVHRANLLDPHLDSLGIGVIEQDGILYVVQDFSQASPVLGDGDIESNIIQLLRAQGLALVGSSASARAACEQHAATSPGARLIVQWEGDTRQLPDALVEQIRQGKYQSAAVGACAGGSQATDFTSSRAAVLLF